MHNSGYKMYMRKMSSVFFHVSFILIVIFTIPPPAKQHKYRVRVGEINLRPALLQDEWIRAKFSGKRKIGYYFVLIITFLRDFRDNL